MKLSLSLAKLDAAIGLVLLCPFLAQNYTFSVRWVGGECEDTANSTQVVAEVEVRFELGNVIE